MPTWISVVFVPTSVAATTRSRSRCTSTCSRTSCRTRTSGTRPVSPRCPHPTDVGIYICRGGWDRLGCGL